MVAPSFSAIGRSSASNSWASPVHCCSMRVERQGPPGAQDHVVVVLVTEPVQSSPRLLVSLVELAAIAEGFAQATAHHHGAARPAGLGEQQTRVVEPAPRGQGLIAFEVQHSQAFHACGLTKLVLALDPQRAGAHVQPFSFVEITEPGVERTESGKHPGLDGAVAVRGRGKTHLMDRAPHLPVLGDGQPPPEPFHQGTGDLVAVGLVCDAHTPTDGPCPLTHPRQRVVASGEPGLTEVVVVHREHPASGVDRPVGSEDEGNHHLDVLSCADLGGLRSQGRRQVSP